MPIDLNLEDKERDQSPVPSGLYRCKIVVKPGGAGEGDLLTASKKGTLLLLKLVYEITDGEYRGKRIFNSVNIETNFDGGNGLLSALDKKNLATAATIGRQRGRALVESGRQINPDDDSERANELRQINSWAELNGLTVLLKVELVPATGDFRARNEVFAVLKPGDREWTTGPITASTAVIVAPKKTIPADMDDEIPF